MNIGDKYIITITIASEADQFGDFLVEEKIEFEPIAMPLVVGEKVMWYDEEHEVVYIGKEELVVEDASGLYLMPKDQSSFLSRTNGVPIEF